MKNLRKRWIIRKKDIIIFDRDIYKYENYQIGISKYKIVPLIFPKEKFKLQKLKDKLTYPLRVFKDQKTEKEVKKLYKNINQNINLKNTKLEEIQTHTWKNRGFLQIMQIRTKLKKNTQLYAKISWKNNNISCIFSRANHNTRLQLQNSPAKAFRHIKNLRP